MKIATHNSWSYLKPKKWWMKLIGFTAKCQNINIKKQYVYYNVKYFDLRVRFDKHNNLNVVHGIIKYNITEEELLKQLDYLNDKEDVYIRVILDVRNKRNYTTNQLDNFYNFCYNIEHRFTNIKFLCGEILYDKKIIYSFKNIAPSCTELYASVCNPKYIDDIYPKLFAYIVNKKIKLKDITTDYIMIDFVNYL